jgi:hypothetical protein
MLKYILKKPFQTVCRLSPHIDDFISQVETKIRTILNNFRRKKPVNKRLKHDEITSKGATNNDHQLFESSTTNPNTNVFSSKTNTKSRSSTSNRNDRHYSSSVNPPSHSSATVVNNSSNISTSRLSTPYPTDLHYSSSLNRPSYSSTGLVNDSSTVFSNELNDLAVTTNPGSDLSTLYENDSNNFLTLNTTVDDDLFTLFDM